MDLEAAIDPDHRDLLDDAKHYTKDKIANTGRALTPVADVRIPITLSETTAAQKTDVFCQTVFAAMG